MPNTKVFMVPTPPKIGSGSLAQPAVSTLPLSDAAVLPEYAGAW